MKKRKTPKSRFLFYIVLILVVLGYRYYQQQQQKTEKEPDLEYVIKQNEALKNQEKATQGNKKYQSSNSYSPARKSNKSKSTGKIASIEEMTDTEVVINFIKRHGALPNYYITKNEARKKGWDPTKGNLCDVLPGKAIGGDHFGNFENRLPNKKGREYKEADINYNCGRRKAKRLIFSNDGLIYTTDDHYNTFTKY